MCLWPTIHKNQSQGVSMRANNPITPVFRSAMGLLATISLCTFHPQMSDRCSASPSEQLPAQAEANRHSLQSPTSEPPNATGTPTDQKLPINTGVLTSEKEVVPPEKPKDVLGDFGIDLASFGKFKEDGPLLASPVQRELLLRILMRQRNIAPKSMSHWAKGSERLKELMTSPDSFRCEVLKASGQVTKIETIPISPDLRDRFGMAQIYRCTLRLGSEQIPAILYTRTVPSTLPRDKPLDERIGMTGIFLKRETSMPDGVNLVFAADRLAWYPDSFLGDLGMDCSLLDTIQNGEPLRAGENEAFYEILLAAKKAGTGELARHAYNNLVFKVREWAEEKKELETQIQQLSTPDRDGPDKDVLAKVQLAQRLAAARLNYTKNNAANTFVPLVETPTDFNGKLVMLRGTAYRIVKVRITDSEIIDRLGQDYYYQVDMLVNLEHKVKLVTAASPDGPATEKMIWRHPTTFCALSLPEGMPTGNKLSEPIRVAGFYFKNWRYETSEMKDGYAARRTAPMLIGQEPVWDTREPSGLSTYAGMIAGGLFIVALIGIWAGVWWTNRSDNVRNKAVRAKVFGAREESPLDGANLEAAGYDFSHIEPLEPHHGLRGEEPTAGDGEPA